MDKLKERLQSCEAALATLDEALRLPISVIVRDAAIQRFEYTFEIAWNMQSLTKQIAMRIEKANDA